MDWMLFTSIKFFLNCESKCELKVCQANDVNFDLTALP